MRLSEIRFSKKFGGSWTAYEASGVEPSFPGPNGKQNAIDYARNSRFGGTRGEIHVYDDAGQTVVQKIAVDGGSGYGQRPTLSRARLRVGRKRACHFVVFSIKLPLWNQK
jgi:hypothetical protein